MARKVALLGTVKDELTRIDRHREEVARISVAADETVSGTGNTAVREERNEARRSIDGHYSGKRSNGSSVGSHRHGIRRLASGREHRDDGLNRLNDIDETLHSRHRLSHSVGQFQSEVLERAGNLTYRTHALCYLVHRLVAALLRLLLTSRHIRTVKNAALAFALHQAFQCVGVGLLEGLHHKFSHTLGYCIRQFFLLLVRKQTAVETLVDAET